MKLLRFFLIMVITSCLVSCATQKRIPVYLENVPDTTEVGVVIPELKIQKNDRLVIQVYSASTMRDKSDVPYNLPATSTGGEVAGLLVDANGNIEYPRVGLIKVEGLTKLQLADLIKQKINETDSVLTDPSVIINFQNLKVSILGEVKSPGAISFPNERVTILEAISMAGDISEFGDKLNIKVVRQIAGGQDIAAVDVTAKDLFLSPYYYLHQNDVVIVLPSERKQQKLRQDNFLKKAGFVISVITVSAVVIRLMR